MFVIPFFKNVLFVSSKKLDALYLFPTNWVLFNLFLKAFTYIGMKIKVWRQHLFKYLLLTILEKYITD